MTGSPPCLRALPRSKKEHEDRYRALLSNVEEGKVFKRGDVVIWQCSNCGHIVVGTQAPEICPVCSHPRPISKFRRRIINPLKSALKTVWQSCSSGCWTGQKEEKAPRNGKM